MEVVETAHGAMTCKLERRNESEPTQLTRSCEYDRLMYINMH